MKRRIGFVVACAAALSVCSCGPKAEQEKADAAAQRETAKEKAVAARTEEVRTRWNAAAEGSDFKWEPNKFPHPTDKGSAEAFGAFAKVLLKFFETDSNFAYIENNNLATTELRHVMPSGEVAKWTFTEMAEQLSAPDAKGNHDAATRKALKAFAEKLKAPPKA